MFSQDLAVATMTIGALSLLAFLLGSRVRSNCKSLFIITIFITVVFSNFFQGNLGWANLVPFSSAVQLSNFTPILVAFIAGFACYGMELGKRSRPTIVAVLASLTIACLFSPVVRPALAPPSVSLNGEEKGIVVLQSHDSTCAAASAATLLKLHGIASNESQMIGPCLTSEFGTEALGLYRGIQIGCKDTQRTASVANSDPHQWLSAGQLPNVALVRFPDDEFATAARIDGLKSLSPRRNWFTGNQSIEDGHAVVVIGYKEGNWTIADPAVGLVSWSDEELRARFTGEAIYLRQR